MSKTVAFTASREITPEQGAFIDRIVFEACSSVDEFVTGACIGGDQRIATTVHDMWPDARQTIFVPSDHSRVDIEWLRDVRGWGSHVNVIDMPPTTNPYWERNNAMVLYANALIGFPLHVESHPKSQRSGTWQTIRLARKRFGVAYVHVLPSVQTPATL